MNPTQESLDTRRMIELLEHQRTLYRRLRSLADRQRSLVVQEDTQPLLALLAERQKLVDALVALNGKLSGYRARWTEVYGSLDEASRKYVSELLEEANATLGTVLQNDAQDTSMLSARHQDMANRMAAMDSGSRATAAYSAASSRVRMTLTDAQG